MHMAPSESIDRITQPMSTPSGIKQDHHISTHLVLDVERHQVPILQPVVSVRGPGQATPAATGSCGPADGRHSKEKPHAGPVLSCLCMEVADQVDGHEDLIGGESRSVSAAAR